MRDHARKVFTLFEHLAGDLLFVDVEGDIIAEMGFRVRDALVDLADDRQRIRHADDRFLTRIGLAGVDCYFRGHLTRSSGNPVESLEYQPGSPSVKRQSFMTRALQKDSPTVGCYFRNSGSVTSLHTYCQNGLGIQRAQTLYSLG